MTSDWRTRAACRHEDPELFFPLGNTGAAFLQIDEAKAVCHRCPAQEECLTWALEQRIDYGVFGGLSEDERRTMLRRKNRHRSTTLAATTLYPQDKKILEAWATGLDAAEIATSLNTSRGAILGSLRKWRTTLGVDANGQITAAAHAAGLLDINGAAA